MPRVLRQPAVAAEARDLRATHVALDPATRAVIDREVAAAYERGRADGRADAQQQAAADRGAVTEQVSRAVAAARAELATARADEAADAVALALRIAREIVGVHTGDLADSLTARVRQVLTTLDDDRVTLWASPGDAHTLAESLRDVSGLTVEMDAALQPGEARMSGSWSDADLTWGATWDAIERALRGE